MPPPCVAFSASELPLRVHADAKGKKRKLLGAEDVDLSQCALRLLTQFRCLVQNPAADGSPVGCWPVQRLFRLCEDKQGTFAVETTSWERLNAHAKQGNGSTLDGDRHHRMAVLDENAQGQDKKDSVTLRTYQQWSQDWEEN
ncbi:hypothetical protein Cob_v005249 [Colletotrichum orbiculare MAFF 240422]|uniref:Uncharacterized protein n=1 Tax=Colletotrichum orbiculare (strain 104-T / ATCC 96160 / CBS 514.97 / LARS 414 / MAFF 240422) TaxID=1213857 RepID=A0A484FVV5_COLOR|nr:hypothetical protein Cob_v005249 [Colletotrichum orbiculare MAFF 240422]